MQTGSFPRLPSIGLIYVPTRVCFPFQQPPSRRISLLSYLGTCAPVTILAPLSKRATCAYVSFVSFGPLSTAACAERQERASSDLRFSPSSHLPLTINNRHLHPHPLRRSAILRHRGLLGPTML
ncbi:hypothetical protein CCMA1212_010671 [Trichoderma ghanense]|uniref:Uncharacterized protein n=1 Tax=Trichoderma ghanense TaxID=65468 RepID=A0ABY2GPS7_9HYPO